MANELEFPAVRLTNVTKTYNVETLGVHAVKAITMAVPRGRFAAIVGPSGSGKTTLLNLIGCIDSPTSGHIEISGQNVSTLSDNQITDFRARKIAFIFQNFNLVPVLSAQENVEFPLLLLGVEPRQRRARASALLEAVGLANERSRRPSQLSGGQQQRVAIARALVKDPEIILADEPTANLDSQTGAGIIELMLHMQRDQRSTFIVSTHDPTLMSRADHTVLLRDGELTVRGAPSSD